MRKALGVLAFLVAAPAALLAHDEKVSASEVRVSGREVLWKVDVGVPGLQKVLKFPAEPIDLTERQLQSMKGEIVRFLGGGLSLEINGRPAEPEVGDLVPVYEKFMQIGEDHIARVVQEFRFRSGEDISRLRVGMRLFAELTQKHRAVLTVHWGERTRQLVLTGPRDMDLSYSRLNPTFWSTAGEFLLWGAHHILIGYDHIAFLLALLLGAQKLGELVKIVTSFTVAHSLTLLLSACDVIRLPGRVTETLIAASIVYVAVENYFLQEERHRWILTFGFGLVHGLGFSSVLRELLLDTSAVVVPVLSFNVGVELGQIAILLVVFPALLWLRRGADEESSARRKRRLLYAGSVPLLLLGLAWLVERTFNLEFMPI